MQMMDEKITGAIRFKVKQTSHDPKTDADMLAEFIAEDATKH